MWLPVVALHLLLAGSVVTAWGRDVSAPTAGEFAATTRRYAMPAMAAALILLVGARILVGAPNAYATIIERNVSIDPDVQLATDAVSLNAWYEAHSRDGHPPPRIAAGTIVRFRFLASNQMLPPKLIGGAPWMYPPAAALGGETYFTAVPLPFPARWSTLGDQASVTLAGAVLSAMPRERMAIDAECEILSNSHSVSMVGPPIYWLRVRKALVDVTSRVPLSRPGTAYSTVLDPP